MTIAYICDKCGKAQNEPMYEMKMKADDAVNTDDGLAIHLKEFVFHMCDECYAQFKDKHEPLPTE